MRKRIVAFIPKGKDIDDFFDDYYIYGCGYPSEDFYSQKGTVKYKFDKAWFFCNEKSEDENLAKLKQEISILGGKIHNKSDVKNEISIKYEPDFFVSYENGKISAIEKIAFYNPKGIMDGYNQENFSSGVFIFRGKTIALNLETHILNSYKEEIKKILREKYNVSDFINSDDLLLKTDDFSETLFRELYGDRKELFYQSFATKKFYQYIRNKELLNIPTLMFKTNFLDRSEMIEKYGEKKGHEKYVEQPLIVCMRNLKNEGKVSYTISRYLKFIHLFGKKKYMQLFKYMFISTHEYIYNGKVVKIKENMTIKDPKKRLNDYNRQVRNYYRRMKRAIKQRHKIVSINAHS